MRESVWARALAVGAIAAVLFAGWALRGAEAAPAAWGLGPYPVPVRHAPGRIVVTVRYLDGLGAWRARITEQPSAPARPAARMAALGRAFPGFAVAETDPDRYLLTERSAPGAGPFFLALDGDRVAVAVGRPGSARALELLSVRIGPGGLSARDGRRLAAFPRVDSMAEAWRVLEGVAAGAGGAP